MRRVADLHLEIVLFNHKSRPNRIKQLVLADDSVAPLDQRLQQSERTRAQYCGFAVDQKLAGIEADLEAIRAIVHPSGSGTVVLLRAAPED